jgi:hypothetical protein
MPGRRSPTTTTARESDIESQNDIESPPDGGEAGSPAMTSPDSFPGDRLAVLIGRLLPTLDTLSLAFDSDAAPEQERSRYVIALYGLAHLWRGFNGSELYSDKFMELASALDDLDDGIQPPLLTPARKGRGRRYEPSAKMRARVS